MLAHIFHMLAAAAIIRVQQRVAAPVEIERPDAELFAERAIEGRRRLYPAPVEPQLGEAVINEEVGADQIEEPRSREMVAHIGEGDARGDAARPRRRREQRRLADAIAAPLRQHGARAIGFGRVIGDIGVVTNFVAHGVVELDGGIDGVARAARHPLGEGDDVGMVAVDELAGLEVGFVRDLRAIIGHEARSLYLWRSLVVLGEGRFGGNPLRNNAGTDFHGAVG